MDTESIKEILSRIKHPEKGEDIVALGLVQDLKIEESDKEDQKRVRFKLVFPIPDQYASSIKKSATELIVNKYPAVKVSIVELIQDKKIQKTNINDLDHSGIDHIEKIVAIASGKGGVGKSTVAVNLAVTLAKMGYSVGLLDADVYGPSIPIMTHTEADTPEVNTENGHDIILPVEKYGIKWISIGYFADPEQALIWRGPMAVNAMKQLIFQVKWGQLDYLLIDLPPGTGDIHISLVNELRLTGAIIVTTPQRVALADVRKGVEMFRNKDVNVPILGIIENMSWFTPEELPQSRYYIFGKEGGKDIAEKLNVPLLGQIPIVQSIREAGDTGDPSVLRNTIEAEAFQKIAELL